MGDILQFRIKSSSDKSRGKTLCREGFHKWVVWNDKQFDVKQGKLVTIYRCSRCGVTKVESR